MIFPIMFKSTGLGYRDSRTGFLFTMTRCFDHPGRDGPVLWLLH